eukprot:PhF_6_TR4375/c0_g1_i1/m.5904
MPPQPIRAKVPPGGPSGKPTGNPRGGVSGAGKQTKSLRDLYEDACKEVQMSKPNTVFLSMLPDKPGGTLASDTLDLHRNYVGDKGLVPILAVVQRSPQLRKLNFGENGLRNNAIKVMCAALVKHPGVTSIDISDNYISEGAGRALEQLLKDNPRITDLGIANTKIDVDLRLRLKELVTQNMTSSTSAATTAS